MRSGRHRRQILGLPLLSLRQQVRSLLRQVRCSHRSPHVPLRNVRWRPSFLTPRKQTPRSDAVRGRLLAGHSIKTPIGVAQGRWWQIHRADRRRNHRAPLRSGSIISDAQAHKVGERNFRARCEACRHHQTASIARWIHQFCGGGDPPVEAFLGSAPLSTRRPCERGSIHLPTATGWLRG
jgi:hypothetical protein